MITIIKFATLLLPVFLCGALHAADSGAPGAAKNTPVSTFKSISIQPTAAFLRTDKGGEARMARLEFNGGKFVGKATVDIRFNGLASQQTIDTAEAIEAFELALPGGDITRPTQLNVTLTGSPNIQYAASAIVQPTRRWEVYLLPHSHVDIGYTDRQAAVSKLHCENIDYALDVIDKNRNNPAGERFVWNVEVAWVLEEYLKNADQVKADRFWKAVKEGYINIGSCYTNANTTNISTQGLMMSYYYAARQAKEHGVTFDYMYQGDIPGSTWGIPAVSPATGLKYYLVGINQDARIGLMRKYLEDVPFYWSAPGGVNKILYYPAHPYTLGFWEKGRFLNIPKYSVDRKPVYTGTPLKYLNNHMIFEWIDQTAAKNQPYNMIPFTWAMTDNAPIDPELPDAAKAWNSRYTSPKIVISTIQDFMTKFEKKYSDIIPHFQGDLTEYWTDGVGTGAVETALYRNDLERMQQLETLSAMTGISLPEKDTYAAWRNLILFSEHTWGSYNSESEPDSDLARDVKKVKQAFAYDAHSQINKLYATVSGKAAGTFSVVNTTAFPRHEMVTLSAQDSKGGDKVVDAKGQAVPSQRLSTGALAFIADVAPFSSVRYSVKPGKASSASQTLKADGNSIENEFYKVAVNPATGNVESIFSKTLNRELVNKRDTLGMNRLIYFIAKNIDMQTYGNPIVYNDKVDTAKFARNPRITLKESGPVVATLQVAFDAPYTKSMMSEFSLVAGADRVEICNNMDRMAVRDKESVNFAFAFDVPSAQIRYDTPAGATRVETDQLPGSNKNWYTIQRWVQVGNGNFSIVWSSPDAPLCCFGGITNGLKGKQTDSPLWLTTIAPTPTIVSWPMNNYWFTNFNADQPGPATFRYYITAQKGNDPFAANRFGVDNSQKLIVTSAKAGIKLPVGISGEGTYIASIKSSSDGKAYIATLINVSDNEVKVNMGRQAVKCNLTEDALGAPASELTLAPREITLVKIVR